MRYVVWTIRIVLALLVFGFFHYTLPQRDIVRIVETEIRRIDFGENSIFWAAPDTGNATTAGSSRDVRFINTVRPNGDVMVYRNEDTGWGWPPYFKLDSSNLQTEAADLVSTQANPQWVVMTHYGWRTEFLSAFPNAVAVRPVDSPDVRLIPWFNIIFLTVLAGFVLWLWRLWDRFKERRIEPIVDDITIAIDHADRQADSLKERFWAWIGRRTGRK
jgi:hypothetical protein